MARSTLELLLDRLNGKEEGNSSDVIPPSLPQRPLSKARLPSKRKRVSDLMLSNGDLQEDTRREVRRFKKDSACASKFVSAEQKVGTSGFSIHQVEVAQNMSASCETKLPQNEAVVVTQNFEENTILVCGEAENIHPTEDACIMADVVTNDLIIHAPGTDMQNCQSSDLVSVKDETTVKGANNTDVFETNFPVDSTDFTNPKQGIHKNVCQSLESACGHNEPYEKQAQKNEHNDVMSDAVLHGYTPPKKDVRAIDYYPSDMVCAYDETVEKKLHHIEHEDELAVKISPTLTTPKQGIHNRRNQSICEDVVSKKDNQHLCTGIGMVETVSRSLSYDKKEVQHCHLKDDIVEQSNHLPLSYGNGDMLEKGNKDISSVHKDSPHQQHNPSDLKILESIPQQFPHEVEMSEKDAQLDVSLSVKKRKRGDPAEDSGSAKKQRKEQMELPVPVPMTMPVPDICTGLRKHRRDISRFFSRLFRRR